MKKLVAYFSASGTTKTVAEGLAKEISADIYEIVPEVPYTKDDLNWKNKNSRSSIEMKDTSSRPAIGSAKVDDMNQYDVVFLMAPIWWYVYPHIANTFLESYDFAGKKIVLIGTSGMSGFGKTVEALKDSAPGAEIIEGVVVHSSKSVAKAKKAAEKYI